MRNYKENIKTSDDLYKLVYFIRRTFPTDSLKLRAGFIWITENISYDIEAAKTNNIKAAQLYYVIKKKKATCSGYSSLLKYFCDAFNIESKIVEGRARAFKRDINIAHGFFKINHSWNLVKINNEWKIIDPTWASGKIDDIETDNPKFYKEFSESYYFTPPEKFILNHFPKLPQDQLLAKSLTINFFSNRPLFTTSFIADSINGVIPDTALIKAKQGDTLTVRFKTNLLSAIICAWSESRKLEYSNYISQKDGWLEFKYPISVPGFYNLYIGYCDRIHSAALVAYRLEIGMNKIK